VSSNFLPSSKYLPVDPKLLQPELISMYAEMARAINQKEIGVYSQTEANTGETYYQDSSETNRNVFRKVVYTTALATGANAVAHSITLPSPNTYVFTRIYGVIYSTSAPLYVPVPNNTVLVTVDGTNINITIPVAYNGFDGQFVLEYLKTL